MVQKKHAISLCRVCSMLMIVLCHIISYFTFLPMHNDLPNILNVGVFSFLLISGYLYGGRTITNFNTWMKQRFLKIALPSIIVSCAVMLVSLLCGHTTNWVTVAFHILQLQGIGFVFPLTHIPFHGYSELGPLWFVTVIMLCYGLVPVLQRLRKSLSRTQCAWGVVILAAAFFLLSMATGVCMFYFLTFSIGYLTGAEILPKRDGYMSFSICTIVMLLLQILRLYFQQTFDGTALYQTYTHVSHMVLGIWFMDFFFSFGTSDAEFDKAYFRKPHCIVF